VDRGLVMLFTIDPQLAMRVDHLLRPLPVLPRPVIAVAPRPPEHPRAAPPPALPSDPER